MSEVGVVEVLAGLLALTLVVVVLTVLQRVVRRRAEPPPPASSTEEAMATLPRAAATTLFANLPRAELVALAPPAIAGQRYPLNRPVLGIGRSRRENALRFDDPTMSRHHARVYVRDGAFVYRDLNSPNYNPSTINDSVLTDEWQLAPGDRITVGETVLEYRTYDPET